MLKHAHYYNLFSMVLIIASLLVSVIPISLFVDVTIPWMLPLMFLWQCHNEYMFNPVFIFIIALIFDFFTGGILGLSSLLFLFLLRLVYNNRFILKVQNYYIKWGSFIILSFVLFLLEYLIHSLAVFSFVNVLPDVISFIFLTLTYPIFYKLFKMIELYE